MNGKSKSTESVYWHLALTSVNVQLHSTWFIDHLKDPQNNNKHHRSHNTKCKLSFIFKRLFREMKCKSSKMITFVVFFFVCFWVEFFDAIKTTSRVDIYFISREIRIIKRNQSLLTNRKCKYNVNCEYEYYCLQFFFVQAKCFCVKCDIKFISNDGFCFCFVGLWFTDHPKNTLNTIKVWKMKEKKAAIIESKDLNDFRCYFATGIKMLLFYSLF